MFLVDLATKGSLTEPHGLQLRHSKLFNTQAAVSAYGMHRDIEAFERLHRPNNVVHIVLRPTLDLAQAEKKGGQKLLDKDGRCPIGNLRAGQRAFNNSVQRAIAELERRELFTPLLVARHLLPFQGGANFDVHAHIVGQVKPDDGWDVQDYLSANFGSDRILDQQPDDSLVRRAAFRVRRTTPSGGRPIKTGMRSTMRTSKSSSSSRRGCGRSMPLARSAIFARGWTSVRMLLPPMMVITVPMPKCLTADNLPTRSTLGIYPLRRAGYSRLEPIPVMMRSIARMIIGALPQPIFPAY